jgi:hypothetical protein
MVLQMFSFSLPFCRILLGEVETEQQEVTCHGSIRLQGKNASLSLSPFSFRLFRVAAIAAAVPSAAVANIAATAFFPPRSARFAPLSRHFPPFPARVSRRIFGCGIGKYSFPAITRILPSPRVERGRG